jgi:hypothetical protein
MNSDEEKEPAIRQTDADGRSVRGANDVVGRF